MLGQDLTLLNNQEVRILDTFLPQRNKKFVPISESSNKRMLTVSTYWHGLTRCKIRKSPLHHGLAFSVRAISSNFKMKQKRVFCLYFETGSSFFEKPNVWKS